MFWFKELNKKEIIKWGVIGGLAEVVYCGLIALLMNSLSEVHIPDNAIIGFSMILLLLVFSVAISGVLVFGYPAYLAWQKRIKEAIWTLAVTLLTFAVCIIIFFLVIILFF